MKKGKKPYKVDKTTWPGAVPYIDIEAFEKGNIRRYADQESSALVNEGDIIVVWDGARCGHVGKTPERGALGSTLGTIQPILIHPDYILRFLQLSYESINTNPRGIGIPHVEPELFWNLEIPLAPLAEQKRIVAKVEELLMRVNATKERLAKVSLILKRFRQAVLAAACSGRLTSDWREQNAHIMSAAELLYNIVEAHEKAGGHKRGNAAPPSEDVHDLSKEDLPISWEMTEMRNLVEPDRPITYGILKPGPGIDDGVPYVRVVDFPSDKLNLSTIRRTSKKIEATYSRARLREGDILLSIRGTVGRVCIVPRELQNANITQDSARMTIQRLMDARFIAWVLREPSTQNRM